MNLKELQAGINDMRNDMRISLKNDFIIDEHTWPYILDVFIDHPVLGNSAVVNVNGALYAIPYSEQDDDSIRFDTTASWRPVRIQYVPITNTVENTEPTEEIMELSNVSISENTPNKPLILETRLIKSGFGNMRDNHYYSESLLEASANRFVGAKMYTTNHKASEVNVRTEVSVVLEAWYDKEQKGLVAKVGVFDAAFAENIRNRNALGVLDSLHCSIRATGTVDNDKIIVEGRTGKSVREFTKVHSVDWVSNAGAGGTALQIL